MPTRVIPKVKDSTGAAKRAIDFLGNFNIPEGRKQGQPIAGKNITPFVRQAVEALIGHRDPATHTRYFRNAFFCAPRKNQKSFLAALVGVLFLFSKQENNGEILIVAGSQRQARRIFELVCGIIRSNPAIWSSLRVQDVQAKLTNLTTNTTLSAQPADPARLYGLSPSVLLLDELHTWNGAKGHKLWTSLTTGQGARANPLTMVCTTVPDDRPAEGDIFLEQLRYAQKVAAGEIDDRRYLSMLWLTPQDADVHDPKVWKKYNPAAGHSISMDEMAEEYEKAKLSDTGLAGFRTMRLNQIAESALDKGWLNPRMLEKVAGPEPVDLEAMRDAPNIALGLDYGGSYDLASLAIVADDDGHLMAIQKSWICSEGYARIKSAFPEVADMVERGELTIVGEDAVPVDAVLDDLIDLAGHFGLEEVGLDPAMSQHLAPGIRSAGLEIVECRQGTMSMMAPMTLLEEAITGDNFTVGSDSLFKWTLGNTAEQSSNMGRKPIKIGNDASTNPAKIDPVSALLSALQLIQEARNVEATGGDGTEWICPWTDPVNAQAVLDGGVSVIFMAVENDRDPQTGGEVIYR